ncbi:uncharacterized protein [Nicotiana tomentosiformis]|uniref:uncharacterized protein n=1 Tax=Nicotiana tomentosiformis TaxID=4098 RepID=UPI00388C7826
MAPFEALYGRRFRSLIGWFELGEARLLGTNLVQDALENVKMINDRLHMTQSRQKSYADRKVRDVAYMVREKEFLRVLPMRGALRFGKKGKLSPRYIGPFEMLELMLLHVEGAGLEDGPAFRLQLHLVLAFTHPLLIYLNVDLQSSIDNLKLLTYNIASRAYAASWNI